MAPTTFTPQNGTLLIGRDDRVIMCSDLFARYAGAAQEALIGTSFYDFSWSTRYHRQFRDMHARVRQKGYFHFTEWFWTRAGWQNLALNIQATDGDYLAYTVTVLTELTGLQDWLDRLDFNKQCLRLGPDFADLIMTRRDTRLIHYYGMMCSTEEMTELLNVSASTIEADKRRIRDALLHYKWSWKTDPTDRDILVESHLGMFLNQVPDWFDITSPTPNCRK